MYTPAWSTWTQWHKVGVLMLFVACLLVAGVCYLEWQLVPERALIPGQHQIVDHTINAALRKSDGSATYFVPNQVGADSVLSGAQLRFSGNTVIASSRLTATPGRVTWHTGRTTTHNIPGVLVRVQATVHPDPSRPVTADTLTLSLPGLTRLGARHGYRPRVSWGGQPDPGDSLAIQAFHLYASEAEMQRARKPYLFALVLFVGAALGIASRAVREAGS